MTIQEIKAIVEWGNGDRVERRKVIAFLEAQETSNAALEAEVAALEVRIAALETAP